MRIAVFFGLACAFTWMGWLGAAIWPSAGWPLPMNPFGPLLAAPIAIVLMDGVAGLKSWLWRLANFKAPLPVYAAALVGPVVIILASVGLAASTGARIQPLPAYGFVDVLLAIPIVLLSGPLEEETTFRGYAQHEIQKAVSPLIAALIVGGGVAIWHAPLIIVGDMAWPMAACVIAVSVVYARLYRIGGSVWPVVALHFSVNYFGPELFGSMVADLAGQSAYQLFFLAFYLAWAGWIVWTFGPALDGRKRRLAAA
jgi:membrane protease YdiL (CAAX protease family)